MKEPVALAPPPIQDLTALPPAAPALKPRPFGLFDLKQLSEGAMQTLAGLRDQMLMPHPRKHAPEFNGSQVAALCNIDPKGVSHLSRRGDLPEGRPAPGNRRMFTLAEARIWIDRLAGYPKRPPGERAAVISVVNQKGGSTKTTTAFNLAQGLTLRGRRVLLIDLDPQASATVLTGMMPAAEVGEEQTIAPVVYPAQAAGDDDDEDFTPPTDVRYAIQQTYWDGLDLIPASPLMYNAEIVLPIRSRDPDCIWWEFLKRAIEPVRDEYDVIIFDTAPSLSYLAVNAVFASDGLLMPVPPENLDYASSIAFWGFLHEMLELLETNRGAKKEFAFMRVLLSRVDQQSAAMSVVRDWIISTYGSYILPVEIPRSPVNTAVSARFMSVYDVSIFEDGSRETYKKIRSQYDRFVEMIDQQILSSVWHAGGHGLLDQRGGRK